MSALIGGLWLFFAQSAIAAGPVITDVTFSGGTDSVYVQIGYTGDAEGLHFSATVEDYMGGMLAEGSGAFSSYPYFTLDASEDCTNRYLRVTARASNKDGSDSMTVDNAPTRPPQITSCDWNEIRGWGAIGELVTLHGSGFGLYHDHADVYFMPGKVKADVWYWNEDEVTVRIPEGAKDGTVHVTTMRGTSNDFEFDVIDNVTGSVQDGHGRSAWGNSLQDLHVELYDKAKSELLNDDYTDASGKFEMGAELEEDKEYRLKVTFESEDGRMRMRADGDTVSFSRDFTYTSDALIFPIRLDCSKVADIAVASTAKDRIDNCGSVWYYLQINRQVAAKAGYDLPADLTIAAYDTAQPNGCSYLLSGSLISLGSEVMDDDTADGFPPPWDFKKNRESHEYGHALMHGAMKGWVAWPDVGNHAGYINANTGDSLSEGFAEFWTMYMSRVSELDRYTPDKYDGWGFLATSNKRMAWSPLDPAHPTVTPTRATQEEFAVAGLLYRIWSVTLGGDPVELRTIVEALPANGTLTDFYDNLWGSLTLGQLSQVQEYFIEHGFFSDLDGDWTRDAGEPVGAGNGANCAMWDGESPTYSILPPRPTRRSRPFESDAFVQVDLMGVPSSQSESVVTVKILHPGASARDYSESTIVTGSRGLVYVDLEPGALAHVGVTGADGIPASGTLSFTYDEWTAARDQVERGAAVKKTFKVNVVTLGTPVAPARMSRTRSYVVTGTLKPRHAAGTYPVRVHKYRYVAGQWKGYGYVRAKVSDTAAGSRYSCKVKLPYRGKWRLRAQAPADGLHRLAWSKGYDSVTVR